MQLLHVLLGTRCLFSLVSCFKILIYSPRFGASHVAFTGRIADILIEEGMDVTVVLPKMNPNIKTNGTKLAKTITIEPDPRVAGNMSTEDFVTPSWTSSIVNPFSEKRIVDNVIKVHLDQCETTLKQRELFEYLKNEQFDLGITELFDLCGLCIFEEIGLKKYVVLQSNLLMEHTADLFVAPNLPAVVPNMFTGFTNKMSYLQRAENILKQIVTDFVFSAFKTSTEDLAQKVLKRKVNLDQKVTESSFVFTNVDPLLDFPRPITERIINIGGISVNEPQPLDSFWSEVVSKRKRTVLVSFGSLAPSYNMPEAMTSALLDVFGRFPEVTFIWKYEKSFQIELSNVVLSPWFPQNDLLNHTNLKLFVTHAGMNSILESSRHGVPMVTVPLFGDQFRNAAMVKRFGTSQMIDKSVLLDPEKLYAVIEEALNNPIYQNNAKRLAEMMEKRPRSQRRDLVDHIKFAAEFGSLPEYRIPRVSFVQHYLLDVIVPVIILTLLIVAAFLYGVNIYINLSPKVKHD